MISIGSIRSDGGPWTHFVVKDDKIVLSFATHSEAQRFAADLCDSLGLYGMYRGA